ncbi:unnamed protein product [Echinostoma caproni]|uniref:Non-specific serine/threonine protein kinase n=1 Tax=Echinostoma caproni TaxID=27848 RepID=A0A183BDG1_9TREM|nr:unnamed protein product [Echinostoma caproni]
MGVRSHRQTQRFEEIWRYRVDPLTDMVIPAMGSICIYNQEEGIPLDSKERKISEVSQTTKRRRRLAAFGKNKPWKTIDLPDDRHSSTFQFTRPIVERKLDGVADHVQSFNWLGIDFVETAQLSNINTDVHEGSVAEKQQTINKTSDCKDIFKNGAQSNIGGTEVASKFFCQPVRSRPESISDSPAHQSVESNTSPNGGWQQCKHTQPLIRCSPSPGGSNIPPHRRQTTSLKLTRSPWKDEDLFRVDSGAKPTEISKSPRHSLTRHFAQPPPIRRRRTLRNLETAKYRVLAAELAHRMVIERGGTNANGHANLFGEKPLEFQPDSLLGLKFSELAHNTVHSLSAVQTMGRAKSTTRYSNVRKSEFRVAQAMTETAAITIAPVETQVAIALQPALSVSPQDEETGHSEAESRSPKRTRPRASLFIIPGKTSCFLNPKHDKKHTSHSTQHSPEMQLRHPVHYLKRDSYQSIARRDSELPSLSDKSDAAGPASNDMQTMEEKPTENSNTKPQSTNISPAKLNC